MTLYSFLGFACEFANRINLMRSELNSCRGVLKALEGTPEVFQKLWLEMTSLAESEAHFAERAKEYALPDPLFQLLHDAGIKTLGSLAFAFSRPGQEFSENDFEQWVKDLTGAAAPPNIGAMAALRRLHFESEVVVTASLKAMVEQPSDSQTAKTIPYAERVVRMDRLKATLQGIVIEGHSEPSQALLDECCQQYDQRILRYMEPAKCTSRQSEVLSNKVEKKLKLNTNNMTLQETKTVPDADSSTAFSLMQCFRRRGLAYDFAQLISFRAHEKYVDTLFKHLSAEPPPNYVATSVNQLLRADREVFLFMSQHCKDIRPDVAGKRPLDDMLLEALKDYHTAFHLMPLPKDYGYQPWRRETGEHGSSTFDQMHKGKGQKGKGKSKHKSGGSSMAPRGMVGCVGRDAKGRNLCFDFNLNECKAAAVGGACKKGRHVCFKAHCFKAHAFKDAHGDEMPSKD